MIDILKHSISATRNLFHSAARHPVLSICAAVLLLRLLVFFPIYAIDPHRTVRPDSSTYQGPARALVQLGRYSESPEVSNHPEIERTPGYPLFIAFSYLLPGEHDRTMLILQIIISVATVALGATIAGGLWGNKARAPAALLLALDPISLLYSQLVLSDSLFVFMLALHLWLVLRLLTTKQNEWLLASGAGFTLAAATFVRPITYYFIAPLLLAIIWTFRRNGNAWRRSLLAGFLVWIAWAPLVFGWQWRNYRLTGVSDFSATQNLTLFFYRGGGIVAQQQGITLDEAQGQLLALVPPAAKASDAAWYAYCRQEGIRMIRENPVLTLKDQMNGAGRTLLGPGGGIFDAYFGSTARYVTAYSAIYLIGIYVLVLICLIKLLRQRMLNMPQHVFLWLVVVYLVAISAGPEAYSRFRLPIMPILAVYAAGGWIQSRYTDSNHSMNLRRPSFAGVDGR
jgi:4-amino-4-deoxy-L-arabinose transferase-like glycosyltransferase